MENQEVIRYERHYDINVAYRTMPRTFPLHWHKSAEFLLAGKDGCKFSVAGEEYTLNAGDILLIWPTELHSVISTPPEATILLQFPSSMIDMNIDLSVALSSMSRIHAVTKKEQPELCAVLGKELLYCKQMYDSDEPFAETLCKMAIYRLLLEIARYAVRKAEQVQHRETAVLVGSGNGKVREACAFITANCEKDLTLPEVAQRIGLSHFYFSRLFKEYTGSSFREYLSAQRVRRAKKLLSDDNLSVTEIAYQSGFQSISNFNRVFLEQTGSAPKEYRKMYRSSKR